MMWLSITQALSGFVDTLAWFDRALGFMFLPRFAVAFERERGHKSRRTFGQPREPHAKIVLLEFHGLTGRVYFGGLHFGNEIADHHSIAGPVIDVRVEHVALAREAQIVAASRLAVVRFVNGRPVPARPIADSRKYLDGFDRN